MKLHTYKSIKLYSANYGVVTLIADFKRNLHDAYKMMCYLNGEIKTIHGKIPENIYYFLEAIEKDGYAKQLKAFYPNIQLGMNAQVI